MSNALTTSPKASPWEVERPTPIQLTENQKKVIRDKYLKDAPTVEAWLMGVANNIALAELLYHPSAHLWGLFDGVRLLKKEMPNPLSGPNSPSIIRSWLFHNGLHSSLDRDSNFHRFIQNCHSAIEKFPEAKKVVNDWTLRFYNVMATWKFLPNSPTLMNAGRDIQQLSACYVLPIEDSMEGITHALQAQALIHKSGGGTGFSFERMRPAGDTVKSTEGVASGVISFMQVFDKMTAVVKQGGNRRGANMGVLPVWHPEIRDFIRLKARPGVMENFNISVTIEDKFLESIENDWEYDLLNPRTKKITGRLSARDVFDLITENAWRSGDPGIIFIDKINNSTSNPTPALGRIESTNPCGEQPLLPNEPCNLGSINVAQFVGGEITHGTWDWDGLKQTIYTAIRFLDDVIDINNYPLPEMEVLAKGNRRIGLGIMGWAEALVKLGIPYDSQKGLDQAKQLMKFINDTALQASEELALERGVFPNWRNSIYDKSGPHFRGRYQTPRHCARTTIAPTGTIGLAAGLQGAGIEPFYALAYTRYNAQALESLKNEVAPNPKDVFFEVNPLFHAVAEKNKFFGLGEETLWKKIEANNKSIRGLDEIPQDIQKLFATAHDISAEFHVRMQATFQAHVDNAVSKTINLPNSATPQDVRQAFLLAFELGCKGITIYRDGSKKQQVLNSVSTPRKVKRARDLSLGVSSEYYEIKTGQGPLHVHIDYDEAGPYRLFSSLPPVGTEISGLTSIIGVLISKYLEEGGNPTALLRHLQSVKGDRPFGLGESKVHSIAHGIGVALKAHLKKHGQLLEGEEGPTLVGDETTGPTEDTGTLELWNLTHLSDKCPDCFSANIRYGSGCSGPICNDCGYSECN
ncbi:MAG: hypothetical protein KCHDKBKB_02776 [Elusimicrobia bacterium]|nr:hypothetical protein [Elusimicrobiota bacterium]